MKNETTEKSFRIKRYSWALELCENTELKAVIFSLPRDYVIGRVELVICGELSYTIALLFR